MITDWTRRKLLTLCARRGCYSPPFDGDDDDPDASCLCRKHRDEHRAANRRSTNGQREYKRRQLWLLW